MVMGASQALKGCIEPVSWYLFAHLSSDMGPFLFFSLTVKIYRKEEPHKQCSELKHKGVEMR